MSSCHGCGIVAIHTRVRAASLAIVSLTLLQVEREEDVHERLRREAYGRLACVRDELAT